MLGRVPESNNIFIDEEGDFWEHLSAAVVLGALFLVSKRITLRAAMSDPS
jgi:hypothetical protein